MNNPISTTQARNMILSQGQELFSLCFIKADRTRREMTCKRHAHKKAVEKNKTGRKQAPNRDPFMVKVWDMNKVENPDKPEETKGAFRTVNVHNLVWLKIGGTTYEII
jgi:hypothetical protein